jgi:hypothetical protein
MPLSRYPGGVSAPTSAPTSFSQPEPAGAAVDRGAGGVVGGVAVNVACDADRVVAEQVGHSLDVQPGVKPVDRRGVPRPCGRPHP